MLPLFRAIREQTHEQDLQRYVEAIGLVGDEQEQLLESSACQVIRSSSERQVLVHPDRHLSRAQCSLQPLDAALIEPHGQMQHWKEHHQGG